MSAGNDIRWWRTRPAFARLLGALALMVAVCAACTPQQQLLMSLLPDGTIPLLLGHFERVDDTNRKRIAEFEQRRDWDGLAKFAEENLRIDRSNSDWWMVAGYAYSQAGQHQRAIECYTEVVRLAPEDDLGWALLGQSYRRADQPERALQIVNRSLNVRRDVPSTWYLQGEILTDLGRREQAASAFREATQLDPQYAQAWLSLGRTYAQLGRSADVRKVALVLEKLDPAMARELAAPPAQK